MGKPGWMLNGVLTANHGEKVAEPPQDGGAYLYIAGRTVNFGDLSLGGKHSHRRPTVFWFPTEHDAEVALQGLQDQEEAPRHNKKREIDLRTPGLPEGTSAWVEPRRW